MRSDHGRPGPGQHATAGIANGRVEGGERGAWFAPSFIDRQRRGARGCFGEQPPDSANDKGSDNNRSYPETPRGLTDTENESEASAIAVEEVR